MYEELIASELEKRKIKLQEEIKILEETTKKQSEELNKINKEFSESFEKIKMLQKEQEPKKEESYETYIQVHKQGDIIKIFSKEKEEITNSFATLIQDIKSLSESDFAVEGHFFSVNDNSSIKLFIDDVIYYEKPVFQLSVAERMEILEKFKFNEQILKNA